jgi:hypothetical protein
MANPRGRMSLTAQGPGVQGNALCGSASLISADEVAAATLAFAGCMCTGHCMNFQEADRLLLQLAHYCTQLSPLYWVDWVGGGWK